MANRKRRDVVKLEERLKIAEGGLAMSVQRIGGDAVAALVGEIGFEEVERIAASVGDAREHLGRVRGLREVIKLLTEKDEPDDDDCG